MCAVLPPPHVSTDEVTRPWRVAPAALVAALWMRLRQHARPWRHPEGWRLVAQQALVTWLVSRLVLVVFTLVAVPLLRPIGPIALDAHAIAPSAHVSALQDLVTWRHWDGAWYLGVARDGYAGAFFGTWFPLYPLIVRVFFLLFGFGSQQLVLAGLVAANLAALAAFVLLGQYVFALTGSTALAARTVRILVASPFAFFLAAPYPESLFLALVIGALFALSRERVGLAAGCVALATVTHPTGLALVPPLVVALVRSRRGRLWHELRSDSHVRWNAVAYLLLTPLPLVCFCLVLNARLGDPFDFVTMQRVYMHHQLLWPWQTLGLTALAIQQAAQTSTAALLHVLFDVVPFLIGVVVCVYGVRRMGWPLSWLLFMLSFALLTWAAPPTGGPLLTDPFASSGRYLLALVPFWLTLARLAQRHQSLDDALVTGGALLQGLLLALWLGGAWVA